LSSFFDRIKKLEIQDGSAGSVNPLFMTVILDSFINLEIKKHDDEQ
jgi:hypothetical protein